MDGSHESSELAIMNERGICVDLFVDAKPEGLKKKTMMDEHEMDGFASSTL